jgi:glycosyltransferase involved in cell wall biosynthesis
VNEAHVFPGRLALQQRVLPAYRAPFLKALAEACQGGLSVFAGMPLPEENIAPVELLERAQRIRARNRHLFGPSSPFFQCWQPGIQSWLEAWQPDALVVEANPRYRSTPQAIRWMHARGRPVLGWGLGAPPLKGWLASLRQRQRLAFLKSLDGIIAYSQAGAAQYRQLGLPGERVFVARNAAAPRPAAPAPPRPAAFAPEPLVLFVGRLQARKRLDHLLRACASLPAKLRPRLQIVGDGPELPALQALAEQVYPPAEFLGPRHGAELETIFARADLFVLPGTGGLAVQQAMAFGLPVIVAEGDGTLDDLVPIEGKLAPGAYAQAENGWRIDPGSLPALSAALASALADVARLRRMGAASYRIVSQEVNLESMVTGFITALRVIYASPVREI